VVLDARTGARKELLRGSASARYVPTGHLVYARAGELRAMPFDLERLEATGPPVKIADGVMEQTNGAPEYSFAATGDLVFVPGRSGGLGNQLVLVNFSGAVEPLNVPPAPYSYPRVSPDGTRIAVMRAGAKNNVWVYDLSRGTAARVTTGRYHTPVWFPDGRLLMAQGGEGNHRLVRRAADGSGEDEPLTLPQTFLYPEAVSRDGSIVIYRSRVDSQATLYALQLATGEVRRLTDPRVNAYHARLSPDGRWLAYVSDETGGMQAYIRAMSGEAREMVSVDGANFVAWAPNGRRLFYRDIRRGPLGISTSSLGRIWSVDVEANPRLRVSRPRLVLAVEGLGGDFDVLPDGERFVMVQVDTTPPPERLELVQDWMRLISQAPNR
jgi:serine/threonine-protein kinase